MSWSWAALDRRVLGCPKRRPPPLGSFGGLPAGLEGVEQHLNALLEVDDFHVAQDGHANVDRDGVHPAADVLIGLVGEVLDQPAETRIAVLDRAGRCKPPLWRGQSLALPIPLRRIPRTLLQSGSG